MMFDGGFIAVPLAGALLAALLLYAGLPAIRLTLLLVLKAEDLLVTSAKVLIAALQALHARRDRTELRSSAEHDDVPQVGSLMHILARLLPGSTAGDWLDEVRDHLVQARDAGERLAWVRVGLVTALLKLVMVEWYVELRQHLPWRA